MLLPSANPFIAPHWLPNQVQASPRVSGHSLTFLTLNPRESDSEIRESLFLLLPAFLPLCLGLHIPSSGTTLPDTTTPPSLGIIPVSEMLFSKASEMGFFVKYFSEFRGLSSAQRPASRVMLNSVCVLSPPLQGANRGCRWHLGFGVYRFLQEGAQCPLGNSGQARCLSLMHPLVFHNACHVHLFKRFSPFKHRG